MVLVYGRPVCGTLAADGSIGTDAAARAELTMMGDEHFRMTFQKAVAT